MHTRYVLGFVFDKSYEKVLLIEKTKPAWQSGLLNGIGGKIKGGETSHQTMERECLEETELFIPSNNWAKILVMGKKDDWVCDVFSAHTESIDHLDNQIIEKERLFVYPVEDIFSRRGMMLSNVPWLVGLCLDSDWPFKYDIDFKEVM